MRKQFVHLAVVLCLGAFAQAQEQTAAALDPDPASLARWQDMRFGMFIHWGPVSIKGTEIGWSRGREVPREVYDQLYKEFNPTQFDAKEWVQLAQDTGMRYVVITSKHHDGFCIWNSAQTDYDIMSTPFRRDILRELSDACKAADIDFGTYYSILDWYQPDYNTIDAQGGPGYALPEGTPPDMDRYQTYMENQIQELVTNYGPLHTMWFDGEWETPWTKERGVRLLEFCRKADPKMLVNNRVGKGRHGMEGITKEGFAGGDFDTPEQQVGAFNDKRAWESCMTLGTQWAWKPDDKIRPLKECVDTLVSTVCGDGNLLLNVGPMPDGRIEARQADLLRELGAWLKTNGESIYGTRGGPFLPGAWGGSTHRGNTIFVHILQSQGKKLTLPKFAQKVLSAAQLNGPEVPFTQSNEEIQLDLKGIEEDALDTIIVLTTAG